MSTPTRAQGASASAMWDDIAAEINAKLPPQAVFAQQGAPGVAAGAMQADQATASHAAPEHRSTAGQPPSSGAIDWADIAAEMKAKNPNAAQFSRAEPPSHG